MCLLKDTPYYCVGFHPPQQITKANWSQSELDFRVSQSILRFTQPKNLMFFFGSYIPTHPNSLMNNPAISSPYDIANNQSQLDSAHMFPPFFPPLVSFRHTKLGLACLMPRKSENHISQMVMNPMVESLKTHPTNKSKDTMGY